MPNGILYIYFFGWDWHCHTTLDLNHALYVLELKRTTRNLIEKEKCVDGRRTIESSFKGIMF